MTITSKFNGKCKKCGGPFAKGEQIEWSKEQGSRHVACPELKTQTSKPASTPGPYHGKFRRVAQLYNQLEQQEAATRPRTTTTVSGQFMTRTA
jgi:hypothetical protein